MMFDLLHLIKKIKLKHQYLVWKWREIYIEKEIKNRENEKKNIYIDKYKITKVESRYIPLIYLNHWLRDNTSQVYE